MSQLVKRGQHSPIGQRTLVVLALTLVISLLVVPSRAPAAPPVQYTPASQLVIVTVNAQQNTTDEARLTELARALRNRPVASGGFYAPDVIVVNEMNNNTSLTSFRNKLNAAFSPGLYKIVGPTSLSVKARFLVNTATMSYKSSKAWPDLCESGVRYALVRLLETASNKAVSVGGVHLRANYSATDCRERNTKEVKRQMDGETRSIVGDHNQRAAEKELECDPFEVSQPVRPWYEAMTSSVDGAYIDAVRAYQRRINAPLAGEWTWEAKTKSTLCDGSFNYKRSRIDYLFVSTNVGVIEAHADHPGWANEQQRGAIACSPAPQCRYSDHRFVWGRFSLQ